MTLLSGAASADLIGHWTFDEGAGTTAANGGTLGAAQDGALSGLGSITWLGSGDAAMGGSALNFNAPSPSSGDLVTIPHHSGLNLTGGPFTLSYWYRNQGDTNVAVPGWNWPGPFRKGNGAATTGVGGWITFRAASGADNLVFKSRNQQPGVWGAAPQGDWMHYVLTFDGTSSNVFYTNSTGTANGSNWGNPVTNTEALLLGRADQWDRADLDDLAIWNNQLSAGEARALYTVPNDLGLAYDAGKMQQMFYVLSQARRGRTLDIDGTLWTYTEDIPAGHAVGDAFDDAGTMYVALDSATAGLKSASAPVIADSIADWSAAGVQGHNGWTYGYYDFTNDPDSTYQASDFVSNDPNFSWTGTGYDWTSSGNPPWTDLRQETVHPNGTNHTPPAQPEDDDEQWVIRRWTADELTGPTAVALKWHMRKTNTNGLGVGGELFVNGQPVDKAVIAGNDATGVSRTYYVNLNPGDVVDLALTPENANGLRDDGSDGSANLLVVDPNLPDGPLFNETGITLANTAVSVDGISGVQGQDGWHYGYYDRTADDPLFFGDRIYQQGEFQPFDAGLWNGSLWDWGAGAPWTNITDTAMHPNDGINPGPQHHAIRRWAFDDDPDTAALTGPEWVKISGFFHNTSAGGNGTTGRVMVDGSEILSILTDGFRTDFEVFAQVGPGSLVDFIVDIGPNLDGDGENGDGNDSTSYQFVIEVVDPFTPVPEPSSLALLVLGLFGMTSLVRRRR